MYCSSFTCSMSVSTCKASQQLASNAIQSIEEGESIFLLDEISISRLLVCGKCPHSNIDSQRAKEAFKSAFSALADKIDKYDEWGNNPDVTQHNKEERDKDYRQRNREEIKARTQERVRKQRIKQLREESS